MSNIIKVFILFVCLTACSDDESTAVKESDTVRAVKLFTISDDSQSENRILIGKVVANTVVDLSFPLSGQVISITVNKGDIVKKNQLLAKLDTTEILENKNAAEANLRQAKVQYKNQKADYDRKTTLVEKGLITLSDVDAAQSNMSAARAELDIAETDLRNVNNQLDDTELFAPFEGVISDRLIDEFTEVAVGQALLIIESNSDQNYEVEFGVPAQLVATVQQGMAVKVSIGKNASYVSTATITEISPTADAGNVFQVKAILADKSEQIKSGLTAEVELAYNRERDLQGVLIPVTAVMGSMDRKGFVYVYHPQTQLLEKRVVGTANQVIGNQVAVTGLAAGEQVVSAGVSFVADGLKVKPYIAE